MNYGKKNAAKIKWQLTSRGTVMRRKVKSLTLLIILLCFVLVLGYGGYRGYQYVEQIIAEAPDINEIDATPSGYMSTVLDAKGNVTAQLVGTGSNRVYVTLDEIPEELQKAFVAIEDERFYDHNGIDLRGIVRAGIKGVTTGHFSEGASTITQQLLKNNVFDGWTTENSSQRVKRKLQEQYLALQLEKKVSKDWIMENYLNTINLGQNTLGVQAASRRYFGKDVSELNLSECAVIAGITQNPSKYNPISHPEDNAVRREKVLTNMRDQGYILQDLGADDGVFFYKVVFIIGQLCRFVQERIRDTDLSDVVKVSSPFQIQDLLRCPAQLLCDQGRILCNPVGMTAGVRILCLNGGGKGLYHLQRHFFILFLVFADFALLAFQFYILDIFDGSYNIDKEQDQHAGAHKQSGH